jgi:hypothetical protein
VRHARDGKLPPAVEWRPGSALSLLRSNASDVAADPSRVAIDELAGEMSRRPSRQDDQGYSVLGDRQPGAPGAGRAPDAELSGVRRAYCFQVGRSYRDG